jgi:hypothetical protein
VTHQPAISFSTPIQNHFNRAGARTSNVQQEKMHSRISLLRPWYRSRTLWISLLGAVAILLALIDSHFRIYQISSGGSAGIAAISQPRAVLIGYWIGKATSEPAEFSMVRIDIQNRGWRKPLQVRRIDYSPGMGYTLQLPHYMLLLAWLATTGTLLTVRVLRKQRIFQSLAAVRGNGV